MRPPFLFLLLCLEGWTLGGKPGGGDHSFNRIVSGRTKEALRALDAQFAREHAGDSDEALLDYVRREAARLGITPNAGEITGGPFLSKRFGGWKNAVAAAGLPPPKRQKPIPSRQIFLEEFRRQAERYRRELAETGGK